MKNAPILTLTLAALSACGPWSAPLCESSAHEPASTPTVICEGNPESASPGPSGLPHTLTVTGLGVATGAPDVVHMQFGVQSRNVDAAAALADNQAKLARVRAALSELGVAEKDVQVASYTLSPQGEMDPVTGMVREPTGFLADNMVSVALRDPTRVNEALAGVFAGGATSIQSVGFMLGDPQRLAAQARELALADARARAEQMARAAGITLGSPLSMQELGGTTAMFPDMYGMAPSPMMPTPGQVQQSMSVNVTYRIP